MKTKPTPRPRKVSQPQQERSVETRERILEEALRRFSEKGFDATGLREIAAELDVSHGLLKYYFGSKDELWREAVTLLFDRMTAELAISGEGLEGTPRERFVHFLRRYVAYCARHPEHARLMVQESMHDNARLEWAAKTLIAARHERLVPVLEALIREGALPDVPPRLLIYAISAAAQAPFMLAPEVAHTHGIDVMSSDVVASYAESIVRIFMR
jgi:AcrR family transcriptional regulator